MNERFVQHVFCVRRRAESVNARRLLSGRWQLLYTRQGAPGSLASDGESSLPRLRRQEDIYTTKQSAFG